MITLLIERIVVINITSRFLQMVEDAKAIWYREIKRIARNQLWTNLRIEYQQLIMKYTLQDGSITSTIAL